MSNVPEVFATTDANYAALRNRVEGAVDLDARFPSWPFKASTGFVTIYEYARILGSSFGEVIALVAETYDDSAVLVIGLSPEPTYYRNEYGFFPGFELDRSCVGDGYGNALKWEPGGDSSGSLGDTLDIVALAGSSGAWALLGQRDWEVGVLLTRDRPAASLDAAVPSYGPDVDLESLRSPAGWGVPLSDTDRATFWRNVHDREHGQ